MGNKAQTAGILTIVSGALGLIFTLFIPVMIPIMKEMVADPAFWDTPATASEIAAFTDFMVGAMIVGGILSLVMSIVAIIGGVAATKRKSWGLALTGSILSVLIFAPTGIPAVIFMALAKPEFNRGSGG